MMARLLLEGQAADEAKGAGMRRAREPHRAVLVAAAAVASALLTASAAQEATVDVQNNSFVPQQVTIVPGDTVRWEVSGSNPHSITSDDGSFDSHPNCPPACTTPGSSFEHTFDGAGEFGYYCRIHGAEGGVGMAGTVVVRAPGSDAGSNGGATRKPDARPDTPETGVPNSVTGIALIALAVIVRRALLARARY